MSKGRKELDDAVLAAMERERRLIGDQLHEKLCQTLAGISIQVGLLTARVREAKPVDAAHVEQLEEHIQTAIDQARSLSGELRNPQMAGAGLLSALGQLADATAGEVPCEYVCEKPVYVRDAYAAAALFRIAEEAVRNAVKHAKAKQIFVSLARSNGVVSVEIRDDGQGFDPATTNGGSDGLGLMRRYSRAIDATLKIQSERGRGTTISCTVTQPD
ncbi:MAG TPA: ATP-binding protein [Verrucomicrobiae bacterium]|jgi:signal transduction histidine kinase